MLLLVVWIVVAVVAVVILGSLGYTVLGAFTRLGREVATLDGELRPVLAEAQATRERAAQVAERRSSGA